MCVNLSARGPTVKAYLKIWPLLGAKFGGQPHFWKFPTTDQRLSTYPLNMMLICPRVLGYSPLNFGWKTKVKAVVGISQNYSRGKLRRRLPSTTTCITLGQLCRYMTPSTAAGVTFENSKIYSIFGTFVLGPYGSQPAVAENEVSPIICAWCVKISAR